MSNDSDSIIVDDSDSFIVDDFDEIVESLSDDDKHLTTMEATAEAKQLSTNSESSDETSRRAGSAPKRRRLVKRGGDSSSDDEKNDDNEVIWISSVSSNSSTVGPSPPPAKSRGESGRGESGSGSESSDENDDEDDDSATIEIFESSGSDDGGTWKRRESSRDSQESSREIERRNNWHSSVAVYKVTRAMETCDDSDLTRYVEDNVFSRLYFGNQQRLSRGLQRLACDGRIRIVSNRDAHASIERCFFCHTTKICGLRLVVAADQHYAVGSECARTFLLANHASMLLNEITLLAGAAHAKHAKLSNATAQKQGTRISIRDLGLHKTAIELGRRLDHIVREMSDLRAVNEDRDVYI